MKKTEAASARPYFSWRIGDESFYRHEIQVLLPGIIKTELLRGVKNRKEYDHLKDMLKGLICVPVDEEFWDRLSVFSFGLLRKGITVPLTDTYIALLCIEENAHLLHHDKHFDLIAQHSTLTTFSASQK